MPYQYRVNKYGLGYWKPTYNPLYGRGVGYTTRRVPGLIRTPSRTVYSRRLRGALNRGGGVKGVLRKAAEQKYVDITLGSDNGASTPNSGAIVNITENIEQGSGKCARVGDKITLSSIEIRGRVDATLANPSLQNDIGTVRLVLFKWYDDTAPTWSDIFNVTDINGAISGQFAPHLPFNHDKKTKRKVLWEKICTVSQGLVVVWNGTTTLPGLFPNSNARSIINAYVDMKRKSDRVRDVHYIADGTAAVGHIYMAFASEAPSNTVRLFLNMRANYTDV